MKKRRIAAIEPTDPQGPLFGQYLRENGFDVVQLVPDRGVLQDIAAEDVDLIVARSAVGERETLRAAAAVSRRSGIPAILAVSDGSEVERVTYLRMGVNDVITPPFSLEELLLRTRALLKTRTGEGCAERSAWLLGDQELTLDKEKHLALLNRVPLRLTEGQWKILCCLAEHGNGAVSRQLLMEECLAYTHDVYARAVDTHIKNLRAKLGNRRWIETVRGYGYRLSWDARAA